MTRSSTRCPREPDPRKTPANKFVHQFYPPRPEGRLRRVTRIFGNGYGVRGRSRPIRCGYFPLCNFPASTQFATRLAAFAYMSNSGERSDPSLSVTVYSPSPNPVFVWIARIRGTLCFPRLLASSRTVGWNSAHEALLGRCHSNLILPLTFEGIFKITWFTAFRMPFLAVSGRAEQSEEKSVSRKDAPMTRCKP
jgi:hypothetical protein